TGIGIHMRSELHPDGFQIPPLISERMRRLDEAIRAEKKKAPRDWQFAPILRDLEKIRTGSEDLAEIQIAGEWEKIIKDHWLPMQQELVELDKKRSAARNERERGEQKELEIIKRAVHRDATRRSDEFLATGWVVPLGKNRKVDGTHKLTKGNQLLFYLKCERYDLNDYANKRIGVRGILQDLPPTAGARLIHVTEIKVLSK
ncbi:MAG: hypothetical protein ACE5GW_13565, partial [Planctomycetota bacterium]